MILRHAVIHVGDGEAFTGDLRVIGGRIAGAGADMAGDPGEEVRDMAGKDIFPGFVDSGNFLGTQDMAFAAKDYNENSSPVTPYLDIWHSFDPDECMLQEFYKAGVTSMAVTPGNEGILGGTCAVVKTYGRNINKMTVRRDAALKASVTEQVIKVFKDKGGPKTPMGVMNALKEALACTEYDGGYRGQRTKAVMDAVRQGRMPVLAACETAPEIMRVLDVTKEYPDMKLIFTLSYEADRAAEAIRERGASVVLGDTSRSSIDLSHKMNFEALAAMAESGTKFGLTVLGPEMSWGRETLFWNASKLLRTCKSRETLVAMMTANSADFFGVADRIGRLKEGLDADYVIYDGNPFEKCGAKLLETVIGGETVYRA